MRIRCPYCGERDLSEFAYWGDGGYVRPDPHAHDPEFAYYTAVYLRDNPAGAHAEFWYHGIGCRSWLKVTRDTVSHRILGVEFAGARR
ncbi:MAG TPA: sarcosine oxidase subunit delta [Steroidobacteraceae bacterium]|jgi:sarcosine oxidase subunit delta